MARWIAIPALIALVGALGLALHWRNDRNEWRSKAQRLTDNLAVERKAAEQAALAYRELEANLANARSRAAEYDALERAILEGDDDVDLPPWFSDYVDAVVERMRSWGTIAPRRGDGSE